MLLLTKVWSGMKIDEYKKNVNSLTQDTKPKVYLIQEIPGTSKLEPKYNVLGAQKYGEIITMLPEFSQLILSPGPLIIKLRTLLKNYTSQDFLLLSGDPAIIGVVCSIVCEMTNGKYKLLKWDRQEKTYYPIEINIHQK
tara:strand:+ start:2800 stop:3216 length:417 start_codon:yes stop_codon:yes gene_type:complete